MELVKKVTCSDRTGYDLRVLGKIHMVGFAFYGKVRIFVCCESFFGPVLETSTSLNFKIMDVV